MQPSAMVSPPEVSEERPVLDGGSAGSTQQEHLLRAIVDRSYQHMALLDLQGRVLRVSQTSLDAAGVRSEDVRTRPFWETPWWSHSAEEQDRLRDAVTRAAQGEFVLYETTLLGAKGQLFDVDLSLTPIRDDDGGVTALISEARDITERRKAECALRKSEEKFSKAFRASPDAMSIVETATGRIIEANDGLSRLFGYGREEVIGRTSLELNMWANLADRQVFVEKVQRQGAVRESIEHGLKRDGTPFTCLFSAECIEIDGKSCMLTVVRDITQRLQAEQALRESERKFATAFRSSPCSLSISDLATGRYLDVNAGFEKVSGYTRDEVIGRTSLELGLWHDAADRAELVRRLSEERVVRDFEVRLQTKGRDDRVTRCNIELIELGGQPCILNAIEDITEQRRAQQAKAMLEIQLREAQKLEALGQLAGGIAHDFNNILSSTLAYAELASLEAEWPAQVREHLEQVVKATHRATDLVRQILTFSRRQKQERRLIRLHAPVGEALKLLRSSLPKTIEISAALEPDAPVVLADSSQVHQVVMNLCTNAAHAMRAHGGKLTVRLEAVRLAESSGPETLGLRASNYARLTVADTGSGMASDTLQRVFEPFFTTKEPGEGTGLGLAVVHGIVQEHDAVIRAQSELGEGTTFEVFFPEQTGVISVDDVTARALELGRGERVLFVDDESMICDSASQLLERLGYRVVACSEPAAALRIFMERPGSFDLVITDLTMPHITGVELARRLLLIRPELPVLLASGYAGTFTDDGVQALGLRGLLAKPLSATGLASAVRRALESLPSRTPTTTLPASAPS